MKITPELTGLAGTKPGSTEKPRTTGETRSGGSSGPLPDTIHLSELSAQLKAMEATVGPSDQFDAAKVEALRRSIREGSFKVDSGVVADRMLESAIAKLRGSQ